MNLIDLWPYGWGQWDLPRFLIDALRYQFQTPTVPHPWVITFTNLRVDVNVLHLASLLWGSNCTLSYGVECWLWEFVSPVNKSPELCVLFRVYKTLVTARKNLCTVLITFPLSYSLWMSLCAWLSLWAYILKYQLLYVFLQTSGHFGFQQHSCSGLGLQTSVITLCTYWGLSHVRLCACYMIFTWHFL